MTLEIKIFKPVEKKCIKYLHMHHVYVCIIIRTLKAKTTNGIEATFMARKGRGDASDYRKTNMSLCIKTEKRDGH